MSAFFIIKKWEFCCLPNLTAQKRGEGAGEISDSPVALMQVPGNPRNNSAGPRLHTDTASKEHKESFS